MTENLGILVLVIVCTFLMGIGIGIFGIPFLKKIKFGQTVREDGPKTHLTKTGTPTIGGIIFIIPTIMGMILFIPMYPKLASLIVIFLGFAIVGFTDDILKIRKKSKDGLNPKEKMAFLILISIVFLILFLKDFINSDGINIPLLFDTVKISPWIFGAIAIFILIGFSNAVNLTDGVDGLAGSVTFFVLILYLIISLDIKENFYQSIFISGLLGSLGAFIIFNKNPAKVFMGDTGSIALGGIIAALALIQQNFWIVFIAGGIYVLETLSVILQVGFFKITKGKRLFKMSPLHHHFELSGWSEKKIVRVFVAVTIVFCMITYGLYKI